MKNDNFEEEPPSYDHAFQSSMNPDSQVYCLGKYHDASFDSFERGEMFIQAFSTQIDAFPIMQAQEVGQRGFLNTIQIDTNIQNNQLFTHIKANPQNPAYVVEQADTVRFWPAIHPNCGPLEDFDATALPSTRAKNQYENQTMAQHYFEITVQQAGPDVVMAIGLCTRPYPIFRMPGWNKFSVGYHSDDGHKFCDDATGGQPFGPSWTVGDTVGSFSGLVRHHYFPSIGADGPAQLQVISVDSHFKYPIENWAGQYI
ncbi:concanavalin A-like lectin/glucanase domain-containing protein [Mucor lusitanicus]